ncbi:hypothetical protein M2133_001669 [Parabacteroides sp. PF5-6]|nr:hypothetical protein [Parabacteroides sp. PF5-6]
MNNYSHSRLLRISLGKCQKVQDNLFSPMNMLQMAQEEEEALEDYSQ